jgi:hypothetical protein
MEDTNVERPNTVAGLLSKRAELANLLKRVRADERRIIADLDHVDGALRLFDPEVQADRIVRYPTQHRAKKGEVVRLVARMLREAKQPLTALDIVHEQMRIRKLKADDATVVMMRKRVGACLTKLKADGRVRDVRLPGLYKGWELIR